MALSAVRPMTPSGQNAALFSSSTIWVTLRGSRPATIGSKSSMQPTTPRVFHSSVASPQPWRPGWSVSTLANTQLRCGGADTTTGLMRVILIG